MAMLRRLEVKGFKSIKAMALDLRPLNVLIGANGAGKSNLISFFKMLNEMMAGRLQQFLAASGRAHSILHYGPKATPEMEARLEVQAGNGTHTYVFSLSHAAGDSLLFSDETLEASKTLFPQAFHLGSGHQETLIAEKAQRAEPSAKVFRRLLNHCRVYHFHDTSATASVRQYCYVGNHRWLRPDAGNLAAFLLRFLAQERSRDVFFTTMIDLYAIHTGFPKMAETERLRATP